MAIVPSTATADDIDALVPVIERHGWRLEEWHFDGLATLRVTPLVSSTDEPLPGFAALVWLAGKTAEMLDAVEAEGWETFDHDINARTLTPTYSVISGQRHLQWDATVRFSIVRRNQ